MQWLMWQMGGVGPMIGQVHHFLRNAKGKAPYAEERYSKEAHRLYGVLDKRLAEAEYLAGDYSIADMATWPWISRFEWQTVDHCQVSQRAALVQGDRGAAGGGEGLSRAGQAAGHPDAGLRPDRAHRATDLARARKWQKTAKFSGVIAPVLTPFGEDGGPDAERFVEHCQWLMAEGCTGLAPFGTTSEGNSLGSTSAWSFWRSWSTTAWSPRLMPGTGALLAGRRHRADQARDGTGLRRRADAAALLLQGAERGGPVPLLRGGDRGGR